MARIKIDYGIDLGTTNSSIARMENGMAKILLTNKTREIMPSCVAYNKKGILVGDAAFNAYRSEQEKALSEKIDTNAFIEFKRTMGTDKKYYSSNLGKEIPSEELSAEILTTLKSFVNDEQISAVVITVPAKFTINQKDATIRAAKLAGFEHCELLQEPIAASMAYGLDTKNKDGFWLVFDFGGGTFDAALLKVEDGIMKVIDTEGDNYLGGKNLDFAIVDEILLPHIQENFPINNILRNEEKKNQYRTALKSYAEELKNELSFTDSYPLYKEDRCGLDDNGCEIEIDVTVTQAKLKTVLAPIFQKAIDITKELLKRNSLQSSFLDSLILVGGPTFSPIIRNMLEEQIRKPDTSVNPMTVVAKGAALFASTINVSKEIIEQNRDKTKIQIELGYEATSVEPKELVAIKILKEKTEGIIPDKIFAEIVPADKAWRSEKVQIDKTGDVIEVMLNENKANVFNVFVYNDKGDLLPSEPNEFTIIQGSKIGSATLPYDIGIEIKSKSSGKVVFKPIKGLEKNQSTPATGIANGLKTQKAIRPGIRTDFIKIPIYQGEHSAEGSKAIYNEHVYDVIITGEELPKLLPEGSDVDLTVKVDQSERISLSAFFPYLDYTEEITVPNNTTQKEIDADWLETEIEKAKQTLSMLRSEGVADKTELVKQSAELAELEKLLEQGKNDYDRKKQVLDNLRRNLRKIDDIQDATEFPKTEEELKEAFYQLENTFQTAEGNVEGLNEDAIRSAILQFKEQIPQIIKEKNVKVAKELIEQMRGLGFAIVDTAMGAQLEIQMLREFNEDFDLHDWRDRNKARMLINQGLSIAVNNPSKQKLRPIVIEIYKLLPDRDKPIGFVDDSVLTD
jgi:molecular chaperone DnaK